MGEAKRKRDRKQRFLEQHPLCCLCGGIAPATTVDHVPSIQMFTLRRRPKGLEVPACQSCNQATRQHEQVAAMLGRIFPDGRTADERNEMRRIMQAVNNNVPGLLEEMWPSDEQQRRYADAGVNIPGAAGVLNCNGPLLNRSIKIFGAKLGFALHYATTGRIVSLAGGVAVLWYSNFDAVTDQIPPELLKILGPSASLRQGEWSVEDQFNYAFPVTEDNTMGAYFSTFRRSFAILSWVGDDEQQFRGVDDLELYRPGCF